MLYQLFKAERSKKNKSLISDALKTMHDCEQDYAISPDSSPFTVDNANKVTTISIDDSHPHFKVLSDSFSCILDRRRVDRAAVRKPKNKTAKASPTQQRLDKVFSILNKEENEIFFYHNAHTITISIKGKHSYNTEQMRKLCTLFQKYDPQFTCKSNHFVIVISI